MVDMKELGIWEPLAVKLQTYKTAVEVRPARRSPSHLSARSLPAGWVQKAECPPEAGRAAHPPHLQLTERAGQGGSTSCAPRVGRTAFYNPLETPEGQLSDKMAVTWEELGGDVSEKANVLPFSAD